MTLLQKYPTAEGTNSWTSPSNARADDSSWATCAPAKNGTIAGIWQTFGVTDPGGTTTISSVRVYVCAKENTTNAYMSVRGEISWDGGTSWSTIEDVLTTTELTATEATDYIDVTSATTWTWTKLNDTNLKVRITGRRGNTNTSYTISMDFVRVDVDYKTTISTTKNSNARIKSIGIQTTKNSDGRIKVLAKQATKTSDARVQVAATQYQVTKNSDARIKKIGIQITKNSDARVKNTYSTTKTSDARVSIPTTYYKGKIDEVSIYTKVLSQSDVTALYNMYVSTQTKQITKNSDARIKKLGIQITKNSDARVKVVGKQITKTSDVRIKHLGYQTTKTSDARVKVAGKQTTKTSDTRIKHLAYQTTKTSDARVKVVGKQTTKNADARVKKLAVQITKTSSARIKKLAIQTTKTSDARIKKLAIQTTKTSDARIKKLSTQTSKTSDARIKHASLSVTKNSDARVKSLAKQITKTSNATITSAKSITKTSDARIKAVGKQTTKTSDAHIKAIQSTTKTSDAKVVSNLRHWKPTSGNLASTAANWEEGYVPFAGNDIHFEGAKSTGNCTWDITTSVSNITIDSAYSGTISLSATMNCTGFSGANGNLNGNGNWIYDSGNWANTGLTLIYNTVKLKMLTDGTTISNDSDTWGQFHTVQISGNVSTITGVLYARTALTIDANKTITVADTKELGVFYPSTTITKTGSISTTSTGKFRVVYLGTGTPVLSWIPAIDGSKNIYMSLASGGISADLTITADSTRSNGESFYINSWNSTYTLILDLAGYGIGAKDIIAGTRGKILGGEGTITLTGNWNTADGKFDCETSTLKMTTTGTTITGNGTYTDAHLYKLELNGTGTVTLGSSMWTSSGGRVTNNGMTLALNGYTFAIYLYSQNGLYGTGTISGSGTFVLSHTLGDTFDQTGWTLSCTTQFEAGGSGRSLTFASNITISGSMNIRGYASCEYFLGSYTYNVGGFYILNIGNFYAQSATINCSGHWDSSPTDAHFISGTSTVTLTGTGKNILANTSDACAGGFYNLIIDTGASYTLGSNVWYNGTLTETGTLNRGSYFIKRCGAQITKTSDARIGEATSTKQITKNSDARIKRLSLQTTKNSDARIKATASSTKQSDARIKKVSIQITKNSSARVKNTYQSTKSSNARVLHRGYSITKTSDARVTTAKSITKTSDARIYHKGYSITRTSDARVKKVSLQITKTSDSRIKKVGIQTTKTSDMRIKVLSKQSTKNSDARIKVLSKQTTKTSNARVKKASIQTTKVSNARIKAITQLTKTSDARILGQTIHNTTGDAVNISDSVLVDKYIVCLDIMSVADSILSNKSLFTPDGWLMSDTSRVDKDLTTSTDDVDLVDTIFADRAGVMFETEDTFTIYDERVETVPNSGALVDSAIVGNAQVGYTSEFDTPNLSGIYVDKNLLSDDEGHIENINDWASIDKYILSIDEDVSMIDEAAKDAKYEAVNDNIFISVDIGSSGDTARIGYARIGYAKVGSSGTTSVNNEEVLVDKFIVFDETVNAPDVPLVDKDLLTLDDTDAEDEIGFLESFFRALDVIEAGDEALVDKDIIDTDSIIALDDVLVDKDFVETDSLVSVDLADRGAREDSSDDYITIDDIILVDKDIVQDDASYLTDLDALVDKILNADEDVTFEEFTEFVGGALMTYDSIHALDEVLVDKIMEMSDDLVGSDVASTHDVERENDVYDTLALVDSVLFSGKLVIVMDSIGLTDYIDLLNTVITIRGIIGSLNNVHLIARVQHSQLKGSLIRVNLGNADQTVYIIGEKKPIRLTARK